ncbi:TlpA family protein disulfide reductase [Alkaliphilus transvaalensis]|uniref:TlpA family protein disulfide reductase n=1 Tax=Alkaliphilus transvaalensis TaxID=114628 RepID=UPI00047D855B|nr:TlpA disulfide reductase family protein [Alkaliphilus transvaalensis]
MKISGKYIILLLVLSLVIGVAGCRNKDQEVGEQPPKIDENLGEENPINNEDEKDDEDHNESDNENRKPDRKKENIVLEDEQGTEVSIYDGDNRLTILTFWTEWSQEAKEQLMILENLHPLLQDEVHLLGIHATGFDTLTKDEVIDRIKSMELSYTLLIDEESEAQQTFFVGTFPTTVIVDSGGNVLLSLTSLVKEDQLLDEIEMILEEFLP